MSKRDYYKVLDVVNSATDEQIKKAYRKLAMKFHPDRVATMSDDEKKKTEEKFKEIQEAYAVLSDQNKRHMYDKFGHAGVGGNSASGGPQGGFSYASRFEDVFETFGDIFGSGSSSRRSSSNPQSRTMRGSDVECQIDITLENSAFGHEQQVTYPRTEKCSTCNGNGAKKGSSPVTCPTCNGHGQVRFAQGFFSIQQTCSDCHGTGKIIKDPCSDCSGIGLVRRNRSVKVTIPAGIEAGSTLRINGEGDSGIDGGPNGDLYVHVKIQPHKIFTRKGKDLHCEVPISFATAALGGEVNVPTIDGKTVILKVPEGTQTNSLLRIKEKGIKPLRGILHGDLYCHMFVETPVKLTNEQKDLLRKFSDRCEGEYAAKHHPKSKSFLDKLKDILS